MDFIIAPLEVYIGKMLIFNRECLTCICVSYKCCQNMFGALDLYLAVQKVDMWFCFNLGFGKGLKRGVNDVYFIKTHVLGHLSQFQFENLTPAATFIK